MVMQVEAGTRGYAHARHRAGDGDPPDSAALVATLVATLEGALLVTHRLLGALSAGAGCHIEVATSSAAGTRGAGRAAGLSPREAEVLRLLAAGMSNRQSAQALFLSPRTVQRHVANIYLKTGAHCRAEATTYALRHGLA